MDSFMLFLIALGWYESFFWGTVILQGTTRPHWRFPRHVFALIVGPALPLVAVVKRIRVVRGPVAKGLLVLAALCSVVWIGMWVTLVHDILLEPVLQIVLLDHESFFTSLLGSFEISERWRAFFDSLLAPWFRLSWRLVVTMYVIMLMPLVPFYAEVYVRWMAYYDARADAFPFDLRRRGARIERRPRLFLVRVRREPGDA
jgi:hypothetical protein